MRRLPKDESLGGSAAAAILSRTGWCFAFCPPTKTAPLPRTQQKLSGLRIDSADDAGNCTLSSVAFSKASAPSPWKRTIATSA